jgi:hypothetical protein
MKSVMRLLIAGLLALPLSVLGYDREVHDQLSRAAVARSVVGSDEALVIASLVFTPNPGPLPDPFRNLSAVHVGLRSWRCPSASPAG